MAGTAQTLHPAATQHLPSFITPPGETDVLMVIMSLFLVLMVVMFGILFLRLHTLPERMAHKSQKIQFEIVAVLGLIALFTHMHIFWIAGLLLAMIDLPDFGNSLGRIAGSAEKIAGLGPGEGDNLDGTESDIAQPKESTTTRGPHGTKPGDGTAAAKPVPARRKELGHA